VFFIGFNKCGTTSFHHLMAASGIRSDHWSARWGNLAVGIERNAGKAENIKSFLFGGTAFSDLNYLDDEIMIDANRFFKDIHAAFPDAYFVLNDRDVDAWLLSRRNHGRGGWFMRCARNVFKKNDEEIMAAWRAEYLEHRAEVLKYFENSSRFFHFSIDSGDIKRFVEFLRPVYRVDPSRWAKKNATLTGVV